MVSDGGGYCAVLDSGGVDCWGDGTDGESGDGAIGYRRNCGRGRSRRRRRHPHGCFRAWRATRTAGTAPSSTRAVWTAGGPPLVTETLGTGLIRGQLDAGRGVRGRRDRHPYRGPEHGQRRTGLLRTSRLGRCGLLGGQQKSRTAREWGLWGRQTPVEVLGVGGTGTLTGVQSMVSFDADYCAVLNSGGIDCWGLGGGGVLGNGGTADSATPVQVVGIGGSGTLTGVQSEVGNGGSFCAVLDSGGVDCWGSNWGNGDKHNCNRRVEGVGGVGTLADVQSVASGQQGYCALIDSGGVDCWGYGMDGELGNGELYDVSPYVSPSPVVVIGVGGVGVLGGVQDVIGNGAENLDSECALLDSGGLDCSGEWPLGSPWERSSSCQPETGRRSGGRQFWHAWGSEERRLRRHWLLRALRLGRSRLLGQWRRRSAWERHVLWCAWNPWGASQRECDTGSG